MATTMNVHEAKTHLSDLLKKVAQGEEVIIAKANKPVAKIVPIETARTQRVFGQHRGKIRIADDFDAPLPDAFWGGQSGDPLRRAPAPAKKAVKRAAASRAGRNVGRK